MVERKLLYVFWVLYVYSGLIFINNVIKEMIYK